MSHAFGLFTGPNVSSKKFSTNPRKNSFPAIALFLSLLPRCTKSKRTTWHKTLPRLTGCPHFFSQNHNKQTVKKCSHVIIAPDREANRADILAGQEV
jgi:hypothetical protein